MQNLDKFCNLYTHHDQLNFFFFSNSSNIGQKNKSDTEVILKQIISEIAVRFHSPKWNITIQNWHEFCNLYRVMISWNFFFFGNSTNVGQEAKSDTEVKMKLIISQIKIRFYSKKKQKTIEKCENQKYILKFICHHKHL